MVANKGVEPFPSNRKSDVLADLRIRHIVGLDWIQTNVLCTCYGMPQHSVL